MEDLNVSCEDIQPILIQPDGINDQCTIEQWFQHLVR